MEAFSVWVQHNTWFAALITDTWIICIGWCVASKVVDSDTGGFNALTSCQHSNLIWTFRHQSLVASSQDTAGRVPDYGKPDRLVLPHHPHGCGSFHLARNTLKSFPNFSFVPFPYPCLWNMWQEGIKWNRKSFLVMCIIVSSATQSNKNGH